MWVYGDRNRRVRAADLLAEVQADAARGERAAALIGMGQLAQGLADRTFGSRGFDGRSADVDAVVGAAMALARPGRGPDLGDLRDRLGADPGELEVRIPEGYAFYALDPSLYVAAARALPAGDWRVIGIRSIGASLAAVAAAELGAPVPVTVRPVGHPFARRLSLGPELAREWAEHRGAFAVVDEGPGLSGSSFGAVADALEALGVARGRIAFLPGHDGDLGPEASPEHRARWATALKPVASFEDVVLPELAAGVAGLVGPASGPLRDISGGGWREWTGRAAPVAAGQERRKFLHGAETGTWLVKFAGLGRTGEGKLARARALADAGFATEPAGLVRGYLVERWRAHEGPPSRPTLDRLGAYLAFRAAAFPAGPADGASLLEMAEMVRVNAREGVGPAAGDAAVRLTMTAAGLEGRNRRVHVDARLHAWEWVGASGAGALKTDALDHSEAHDLIGAQDIGWDVAGAEAEFDLPPAETERLRAALDVDRELLGLLRPAYLAFQLGLWTMAAEAQAGWPKGFGGARAQADRYRDRLAVALGVDPASGPS